MFKSWEDNARFAGGVCSQSYANCDPMAERAEVLTTGGGGEGNSGHGGEDEGLEESHC
jgi:hypothetical protein